jgi:AcrR family transcriptional regulator
MSPARRNRLEDSSTSSALLDATEQIMLEEGYAAVSSRRIASRAGVTAALVHYYFGTMDELFIAVFRRIAERSLLRQARVLSSSQPLWGLWESTRDQINTALLMEFNALANHHKAVQAEIAIYSKKFRRMQIEIVSTVLERYGIDPTAWPPATIILLMTGISRFMMIEEAFNVDIGHAETIAVVERHIRELEGDRRPTAEEYLARFSS